jgi:Tfp pilus assembly protein PilV
MQTMKKKILQNEQGFALIAALLACLILLAIGMLVIQMSTSDLRTSAGTVGEKKALIAVESGIHQLLKNFDPNVPWDATHGYVTQTVIPGGIDDRSRFTISVPTASTLPPVTMPGYALGASQQWGMMRYDTAVKGESTTYSTVLNVDVGVGYGPVPIGTTSR